jgi:AcrR family transcriptional regulator
MPLIVDHEERRHLIASVVKRMVAAYGMEAVTVRAVAREAGFSSTIVSHYFRDKRDLMSFTYSTIRARAIEMIDEAIASNADMLTCFERLLPVNEANLADWQAWFGFWGKATSDANLAAERVAGTEGTQNLFLRILDHACRRGELSEHLDLEIHAYRLQMFVNGLASFVVMQPKAWPPERQHAMMAAEIELMKSISPMLHSAVPAAAEPAGRRRGAIR